MSALVSFEITEIQQQLAKWQDALENKKTTKERYEEHVSVLKSRLTTLLDSRNGFRKRENQTIPNFKLQDAHFTELDFSLPGVEIFKAEGRKVVLVQPVVAKPLKAQNQFERELALLGYRAPSWMSGTDHYLIEGPLSKFFAEFNLRSDLGQIIIEAIAKEPLLIVTDLASGTTVNCIANIRASTHSDTAFSTLTVITLFDHPGFFANPGEILFTHRKLENLYQITKLDNYIEYTPSVYAAYFVLKSTPQFMDVIIQHCSYYLNPSGLIIIETNPKTGYWVNGDIKKTREKIESALEAKNFSFISHFASSDSTVLFVVAFYRVNEYVTHKDTHSLGTSTFRQLVNARVGVEIPEAPTETLEGEEWSATVDDWGNEANWDAASEWGSQ